MFLRWLFSGTSVTLTLVSVGTLLVSCSDDSNTGGCAGACSHSWSLCKDDLTASGQQESDFTNTCLQACRNAATSDARALGQSLNCATQAKECDSARQCSTFGPLLGSSGNGGFAGFAGFAGFGATGLGGSGGFSECSSGTVSTCSCFDGSNGVRTCQLGFWGACTCSGAGGSGGGVGCSDGCFYSNNGLCDDGGPNSSTSRCTYGTDCSDCGTRFGSGGVPGSGGFGAGGGTAGCSNTCSFYAYNSQCDDGGPNSISSLCALGTDCFDCGTRVGTGGSFSDSGAGGTSGAGGSAGAGGAGGAGVDGGSAFCSDGCTGAGNLICEDGGPNASSARCSYGTDCADCGARPFTSNGAAGSPGAICSNTCSSANDLFCDDDGVTCTRGTDCNDCGSRTYTGGYLCTDACGRTNGVCEDGGFSSSTSLCAIGTDCSDCGPR